MPGPSRTQLAKSPPSTYAGGDLILHIQDCDKNHSGNNILTRMEWIKLYYDECFTLIPLHPATGKPLLEWKQYQDPKNRPSWQVTEKWFKDNENGIAVILGLASDNLFCLDEDKVGLLLQVLHGDINALRTLIQKSPSQKHHLFLRDRACKISVLQFLDDSGAIVAEIKGNGHLVTLAPSLHRELHQPYINFCPALMVRETDTIVDLLASRIKEIGYKVISPGSVVYADSGPISCGALGLTESETSALIDVLTQLWHKGRHHRWITGSAGWLLLLGIGEDEVANFIAALSKQLGCPKRCWVTSRRQVKDLYRASSRANAHIPGFTSLTEIALAHGRQDLVDEMVRLNKRLKRNKEIKESAHSWLDKKTAAEKHSGEEYG